MAAPSDIDPAHILRGIDILAKAMDLKEAGTLESYENSQDGRSCIRKRMRSTPSQSVMFKSLLLDTFRTTIKALLDVYDEKRRASAAAIAATLAASVRPGVAPSDGRGDDGLIDAVGLGTDETSSNESSAGGQSRVPTIQEGASAGSVRSLQSQASPRAPLALGGTQRTRGEPILPALRPHSKTDEKSSGVLLSLSAPDRSGFPTASTPPSLAHLLTRALELRRTSQSIIAAQNAFICVGCVSRVVELSSESDGREFGIGFIGCGGVARTTMGLLARCGVSLSRVVCSVPVVDSPGLHGLRDAGVDFTRDPSRVFRRCRVVFLCFPPLALEEVATAMKGTVRRKVMVVSNLATISVAKLATSLFRDSATGAAARKGGHARAAERQREHDERESRKRALAMKTIASVSSANLGTKSHTRELGPAIPSSPYHAKSSQDSAGASAQGNALPHSASMRSTSDVPTRLPGHEGADLPEAAARARLPSLPSLPVEGATDREDVAPLRARPTGTGIRTPGSQQKSVVFSPDTPHGDTQTTQNDKKPHIERKETSGSGEHKNERAAQPAAGAPSAAMLDASSMLSSQPQPLRGRAMIATKCDLTSSFLKGLATRVYNSRRGSGKTKDLTTPSQAPLASPSQLQPVTGVGTPTAGRGQVKPEAEQGLERTPPQRATDQHATPTVRDGGHNIGLLSLSFKSDPETKISAFESGSDSRSPSGAPETARSGNIDSDSESPLMQTTGALLSEKLDSGDEAWQACPILHEGPLSWQAGVLQLCPGVLGALELRDEVVRFGLSSGLTQSVAQYAARVALCGR